MTRPGTRRRRLSRDLAHWNLSPDLSTAAMELAALIAVKPLRRLRRLLHEVDYWLRRTRRKEVQA